MQINFIALGHYRHSLLFSVSLNLDTFLGIGCNGRYQLSATGPRQDKRIPFAIMLETLQPFLIGINHALDVWLLSLGALKMRVLEQADLLAVGKQEVGRINQEKRSSNRQIGCIQATTLIRSGEEQGGLWEGLFALLRALLMSEQS